MEIFENFECEKVLNKDELERYKRHISLQEIGIDGQINLKNSSVIFIGAGGLGSSAILYTAAAGIGTIGIVDNDLIEKTNLQRQIIHNTSKIGEKKITSAKLEIEELNPHCNVFTYFERLNSSNILNIIKPFDIICDCSDNFGTRYLINDACILLNKPFIFGAVQGFEGQVTVFNLNKNSPNLRDLIPKSPLNKDIPSCQEFGVIGASTGLIGILQANEIIKIILNKGNILNGELLIFNLLEMTMKKLRLKANPYKKKYITNLIDQKDDYEENSCINEEISIQTIQYSEFGKLYKENFQNIVIIDVREEDEFQKYSLKGSISVPLSIISNNESLNMIKEKYSEKIIYTLCQKGKRSKKASRILLSQNIHSFSIEGGLEKIKKLN
tara:strand:+ start:208 stop:1359 length:1152 start_codon:yes stop_codon:yes gene_type:complete